MKTQRERRIHGDEETNLSKVVDSPLDIDYNDVLRIVRDKFDTLFDSTESLLKTGSARRVVDAVIETQVKQDILADDFVFNHFVEPNEVAQVKFTAADAGLDYKSIQSYDDLLGSETNRQAIADQGAVSLIRSVDVFRKEAASYVDFTTDLPYEVVGVYAEGGDDVKCFYYEQSGEFVVSHIFTRTTTQSLTLSDVQNPDAIDMMAIAAGGGGYHSSNQAGGGGAGELMDTTRDGGGSIGTLDAGGYTVQVGSGNNNDGNDTIFQSDTNGTIARVDGGGYASGNNSNGRSGGCGSGASSNNNNNYTGGGSNANVGFGTAGGSATAGGNGGTAAGGGGVAGKGVSGQGPRPGSGGPGMYVGHYYPGIGERGYVGGGGGAAPEPNDNGSNYLDDDEKKWPRSVGAVPTAGGIGGGGSASRFAGSNSSNTSGGNHNSNSYNYEEWAVHAPSQMSQPGLDGTGGGGGGSTANYSSSTSYGGDGQAVLRLAAPDTIENPPVDPKEEIQPNMYTMTLPKTWEDWEETYAR